MNSASLPSSSGWLDALSGCYERNQLLDAWRLIEARGGLSGLSSAEELIWGGRVLSNLLSPRAAQWCMARARRLAPSQLNVAYFAARQQRRFGPVRALAFLDSLNGLADLENPSWSDLLLLRAEVLTGLRDFSAAEQLHDEVERLAADRPWASVCRSLLLDAMDRPREALALIEGTRVTYPDYRPAFEVQVDLLIAASREDEALQLLEALTPRTQLPLLWSRRAQLEELLGRPEAAWSSLEQVLAQTPRLEKGAFMWLAGRRSDLAARLGQWELAITLGRNSGAPFHVARAEHMEAAGPSVPPHPSRPLRATAPPDLRPGGDGVDRGLLAAADRPSRTRRGDHLGWDLERRRSPLADVPRRGRQGVSGHRGERHRAARSRGARHALHPRGDQRARAGDRGP